MLSRQGHGDRLLRRLLPGKLEAHGSRAQEKLLFTIHGVDDGLQRVADGCKMVGVFRGDDRVLTLPPGVDSGVPVRSE